MNAQSLSQERLKNLLDYQPDTGLFTWKSPTSHRVKRGAIANCRDAYGYVVIRLDGVLYKAHRLAWLYIYGEFPCDGLDHINRVKHDNRIDNLRVASQQQNMQNLSDVKGVYWDAARSRWAARIKVNYKTVHLGRFVSYDDAIAARKKAEIEHFEFKAA